ncbi:MAG TPA: DUF4396 domain-containing protein [Opitutus sp.]|nr:DUF4396 domain-containing protein [Opitutus sp.]
MITVIPEWLHTLAEWVLVLWAIGGGWIALDVLAGHRQHMWIMNVVWPVTALWAGPLALWAYYRYGRKTTHRAMMAAKAQGRPPPARRRSFGMTAALGTTHCGAGCTLGDIVAEWFVFFVPVTLWGEKAFGTWLLDYLAAFLLGIAFQYFTIKPMKGLSPGKGLVAALKADSLSLTSWQLGMYGWMALVIFVWFGEIEKTNPVFWFMMQIAMCCGFATSYLANWWLIRRGIKEAM